MSNYVILMETLKPEKKHEGDSAESTSTIYELVYKCGGEYMYETIIATVGNIIAALFSGRFSKSKVDNEQLVLQLSEIQHTIDTELRKANDSLNNLQPMYQNQTLQLFFETLKSLNVRISIGCPSSNVTFTLQSSPAERDINQALNVAAQNILDFETIKPIPEILGIPKNSIAAEVEYPSADIQFQDQPPISAAQIMQRSKDRLRQLLEETRLR